MFIQQPQNHSAKRFSSLFVTISAVIFASLAMTQAQAQQFKEGVHYTVIAAEEKSDQNVPESKPAPEVVEFFSFSCPACYSVEPSMKVLEQNAKDVTVRRVHMPFGGPKAKYSQKLYVLMLVLDAEQHKDAVFKRIHSQRNTFDSDDEIVEFFTELGYEQAKVQQALKGFGADTMIRKMNKEAINNKIQSVPTIIVNGRYKVSIGQLADATTLNRMVAYLNSL